MTRTPLACSAFGGLWYLFTISVSADKILLETKTPPRAARLLGRDGSNTTSGETFLIRQGKHPSISYPNLSEMNDTEINVRWLKPDVTSGKTLVVDADDCPRHFLWLSDQAIEAELEYRLRPENTKQKWSDRVLVEKAYFTLFYGGTGLASQYLDAADHFETDLEGWDIMERDMDKPVDANIHCSWEGLECDDDGELTAFRLEGFALEGQLPTDIVFLSKLEVLDLNFNSIKGTIPENWGTHLTNLKTLNLAANELTGRIPPTLVNMVKLENLWLGGNKLRGTISDKLFDKWTNLVVCDLSDNKFRGTIPTSLITKASNLHSLYLEGNQLSGSLPSIQISGSIGFQSLEVFDVGHNKITGTIPTSWFSLPELRDWNLAENNLSGTIPTLLMQMSNLEVFVLSSNAFTGSIPKGKWNNMTHLTTLLLNDNKMTGPLEPSMLSGLAPSLLELDIANNKFSGSIPTEIGRLTKLERIDAQNNMLEGTIPSTMNKMYPDVQLNLTNNLLTGTVPKIFCGGGIMSPNILYRQFGCDAVLCPAGTFHPNGAASLFSGCKPCPVRPDDDPKMSKILGRTTCESTTFHHGDLNGDGVVSEREVLRLLYTYTIGRNWGAQFENWADTTVDKCDLNGVTCIEDSVAKLDLTDAALCSNGERKSGIIQECKGIPAEMSLLSNLEVLVMSRRQFLRGSLPTEIGKLGKLRFLDLSNCPHLTGPLPSELGNLTSLRYLNLGGCRFNSTLPTELFQLSRLEKLHLSSNSFSGTLPTNVGKLTNVKEFMLSRTQLSGRIPDELGDLTSLENVEMYGNRITGTIPDLSRCTNLKRVDLFNNQLSGTIPESIARLTSLQIFHMKNNLLNGTISSSFGTLPHLSWFDVSTNHLHGTISETFGMSSSLKDFRVGGNMIYDPVPKALCKNPHINGGMTKTYGCAGVICPLGTYSDPGHATHSDGCKPCPGGETTLYLGSSSCTRMTEKDILTILYSVMGHSSSSVIQISHWLDQDDEDDVCSWRGIHCDSSNRTETIWFPLYGLHDKESDQSDHF